MIDIVNTVICYDNPEEVVQYAEKFFSLKGNDHLALTITINKISKDKYRWFQERIKSINNNIHIYNPGTNLGYLNGMCFGYKSYLDEFGDKNKPRFIIMSNTDIDYPDNLVIEKLRNKEYKDNIWCIGPSVYAPFRKSYDNPVCYNRRSGETIKRLIKRLRTPIISQAYMIAAHYKGLLLKRKEEASCEVYEVHGCYFIIASELADILIKKPFGALLYSEEAYIAENIYLNNKIEYYDSELKVYHMEHSVTSKLKNRRIAKHIADSMEVVLQEYYE